jgi:hypothetical protein
MPEFDQSSSYIDKSKRHQWSVSGLAGRENASKVATHLAVLESMDKKTGPRYQPRLNILGCFTVVHAFRTDKPQKPACAMVLPAHTGLKHSIASGMELPA